MKHLSYLEVWLAVFARQLGLPFPAVLTLMLAGSLAAQHLLDTSMLLAVSVAACLCADGVWFIAGRIWGAKVVRALCRVSLNPTACRDRAHRTLERWGLRVLIVAKFIPGLDGAAPPLAGAEGYSGSRFLLYDSAGALLWTCLYGGVGVLFSDRLVRIQHGSERFASAITSVVVVSLVVFAAWRLARIWHMVRDLRLHRISPLALNDRMAQHGKVVLVDLSALEDRAEITEYIPGAILIDPARLQSSARVHIPDDVELVLYCSSKAELISARVALAMRRQGVRRVSVLEGGLEAWKKQGLDTASTPAREEELVQRLGIVLPAL